MKFSKEGRRKRIHYRIRKKVKGTAERPRLSIYRSNKAIYVQLIDDVSGSTITSANSLDATIPKDVAKAEQAKAVGKLLAEKAKSENVTSVVFDRGGYLYHGRVKALAEGAREAGLQL